MFAIKVLKVLGALAPVFCYSTGGYLLFDHIGGWSGILGLGIILNGMNIESYVVKTRKLVK